MGDIKSAEGDVESLESEVDLIVQKLASINGR